MPRMHRATCKGFFFSAIVYIEAVPLGEGAGACVDCLVAAQPGWTLVG